MELRSSLECTREIEHQWLMSFQSYLRAYCSKARSSAATAPMNWRHAEFPRTTSLHGLSDLPPRDSWYPRMHCNTLAPSCGASIEENMASACLGGSLMIAIAISAASLQT